MANISCATKVAITLYICVKLTSSLFASDRTLTYPDLCKSIANNQNLKQVIKTAEARPNRFTEGNPMPIMLAMERLDSSEFAQILIGILMEKGMSVNVRDASRRSMLHAVAMRPFSDKEYVIAMVLHLLDLGIDSYSLDMDEKLAEQYLKPRLHCVVKKAVESRGKPVKSCSKPSKTTSSSHSKPADVVVQEISTHPNETATIEQPCLKQEQRAEIVSALLVVFSGSKNDRRTGSVIDE